MSATGIVWATFLVSLVGGLVPLINVEVYLVSISAFAPQAGLLPVVVAASVGQVAAKLLLYGAGLGALRLRSFRNRAGLAAMVERLRAARVGAQAMLFASALLGVPPFYLVSVAAGVLRLSVPALVVLGLAGRLLRFAAIFLLPRLLA